MPNSIEIVILDDPYDKSLDTPEMQEKLYEWYRRYLDAEQA